MEHSLIPSIYVFHDTFYLRTHFDIATNRFLTLPASEKPREAITTTTPTPGNNQDQSHHRHETLIFSSESSNSSLNKLFECLICCSSYEDLEKLNKSVILVFIQVGEESTTTVLLLSSVTTYLGDCS